MSSPSSDSNPVTAPCSELSIEVFWGHCDAAGIVFYPRYFEWFDACSHRLLEHVGLSHHLIRERYQVVGTPIVDAGSSFVSPATFGDVLTARSYVSECGTSRFTVKHELFVGERPVCRGHEMRVWAAPHPEQPGRLKAVPIPDEVRRALLGA